MSETIAIQRENRGSLRHWGAVLSLHAPAPLLAVVIAATGFVYMRTAFVLDLPLMHFISWRVGEGDAPYVDLWDMNGPATYMLHWLMQQVPLPESTTAVLAMMLLTTICVVSVATIAGRGERRWLGAAAGIAMAAAIAGRGADMLAQRDMFIAAFAAAALALIATSRGKDWRWAVAGALIGLSVGVKPTAAPFALIAAAGAIWIDLGDGRQFRRTLWLAGGGAAGGAVWMIYLIATGGLSGWWSIMAGYNAAYAGIAREPLLALLKEPAVLLATMGGAACVLAGLVRQRAGADHEEVGSLLVVGGFAIASGALYLLQGKGWAYQAAPATVMSVISICAAVASLGEFSRERKLAVVAATLVAVVFSIPGIRAQLDPIHVTLQSMRTDIASQMTASLNTLPPGMKVQPLDTTDGALHAMTDAKRDAASPVLYDFFLFLGDPEDIAKARAEVLKAANRRDTAFLITNQGWPGHGVGFKRTASFTELQSILDAHYTIVSTGHRGQYDYRLYAPAQ